MHLLQVISPYTGKKEYLNQSYIASIFIYEDREINKPTIYFLKVSVEDHSSSFILNNYSTLEYAEKAMHEVAMRMAGVEGAMVMNGKYGSIIKAPEEGEL